jgi:hypothetical protein
MCGWIISVRKTNKPIAQAIKLITGRTENKPKTATTMVWLDRNAPTNM